jgi:hypothetical protein
MAADSISPFRQREKFFIAMSERASLTRHRGEAANISAASSTNQKQK